MILLLRLTRCALALRRSAILLLAVGGFLAAGDQAQRPLPDASLCDRAPDGWDGEPGPLAPALSGTQAEARAVLRRLGVRVQAVEVAAQSPPGQVVSQWPKPGEPILGGRILLCVSAGRDEEPRMPSLIGSTPRQAERLLAVQGIRNRVEVHQAPDPEVGRGRIFGQSPPAGSMVAEGERIVLQVSEGPPEVILRMPAVTGLTVAEAAAALVANRIGIRPDLRRAPHATAPPDRVYGQTPAAGTVLSADDAIVLDVSEGPPAPVRMPSVAGMTVDEARRALAGLPNGGVPEIRRAPHESAARDRVYRQSPAAGAEVSSESVVVLDVSEGPPRRNADAASWVVVPSLQRLEEAEAVARLAREGLVAVPRGSRHSALAAGQVIETRPAAGERVPRGAPIYYALSLGPPAALAGEPRPDRTWLLIALVAAAALAAAAIAVKPTILFTPRVEVRIAGPPLAHITWGDPPTLDFEVSAEPPVHALRLDGAERPAIKGKGGDDGE